VLGAIYENAALGIVERHLGLMPANESDAAREHIAAIAGIIGTQVDLARLLEVTEGAAPLPRQPMAAPARSALPRLRVGLARDQAFGFYYADDLDALAAAGAELMPFSPIADHQLPEVDALFLGGGFPECFMAELEANGDMRAAVRDAIEGGMPAYAECGGLMYLARSLSWKGETRRMAGVIPGDVVMHDKPVGRGYVRLAPTDAHPWVPAGAHPAEIPAHEFHYSSLDKLDSATVFAYRVARGHGIDGEHDGIVYKNLLASYTHLRSVGNCDWATRFIAFARSCMATDSNKLAAHAVAAPTA
jgi:cobyrinic acid a,c-diamide synthase